MLRRRGKICYIYAAEIVAGEDGLQVVGHGWKSCEYLRKCVVDV